MLKGKKKKKSERDKLSTRTRLRFGGDFRIMRQEIFFLSVTHFYYRKESNKTACMVCLYVKVFVCMMCGKMSLLYLRQEIAIINILGALMEKADNIKEQMDNVSRETETLRKNQKEMLEIKNTTTEIKNAFRGFISRWDVAEERTSEPQYTSINRNFQN